MSCMDLRGMWETQQGCVPGWGWVGMPHRLKGDIGGLGGRKEPERAVNFPAMAEGEAWKFLLHLCLHQGQLPCPPVLAQGTLPESHSSSLHSEMGDIRPASILGEHHCLLRVKSELSFCLVDLFL